MLNDVLHGYPLPNCPYSSSYLPPDVNANFKYHNPAISSTYYLLALTFLVISLLTLVKFNKVKIFNREITHPSITNVEYLFFFLFISIGFIIDAVRYTIDLPFQAPRYSILNGTLPDPAYVVGPAVMDAWLLLGSSIFRSISLLFLCLALNQQRIHRSTAAAETTFQSEPEFNGSPARIPTNMGTK